MVMANPKTPEFMSQWKKFHHITSQLGVLRNIYWDSHLVQNLGLRKDTRVIF